MTSGIENDQATGRHGLQFHSIISSDSVKVLDVPGLVHGMEYDTITINGRNFTMMRVRIVLVLVIEHPEPILAHVGHDPEHPMMGNSQVPGVLQPGDQLPGGLIQPRLSDH